MSQSNRNKLSMKGAKNNKKNTTGGTSHNSLKNFFCISSVKLNEDEDDSLVEINRKTESPQKNRISEVEVSLDKLNVTTKDNLVDEFSFKKDFLCSKLKSDSLINDKSGWSTNSTKMDTDMTNNDSDDDDEDVPIPDIEIKKTNSVENCDVIPPQTENVLNQCPICLKSVTKHVSHMKACAAKNNLTTQQLLSALKLQKKQLAERRELGLGPVTSFRAKSSPKRARTANNKGPVDVNMQLALALSASLHSAEENELIQEAEALRDAGLNEEAEQKLSTLEQFGFESAVQPLMKNVQGGSKSRAPLPTLLLKRSKEERERIITEKVAIVLISDEEKCDLSDFVEKEPSVKSKMLKKKWNKDNQLWSKAQCPEETERGSFYVNQLADFVSPSKAETGAGMRRLSQLPGRLNTPEKDDIGNVPTPETTVGVYNMEPEVLQSTPRTKTINTDEIFRFCEAPTLRRRSVNPIETSALSKDWRSLVDNPVMSDVEVQCDGGKVFAHKLVFHVRCPTILSEIVKQKESKDILLLDTYSKTSVVALLVYVYSGELDLMHNLSNEDFTSLNDLAVRFDYSELKTQIRLFNSSKTRKSVDVLKRTLFSDEVKTNIDGSEKIVNQSQCEKVFEVSKTQECSDDAINKTPVSTQRNVDNFSDGGGSPDMFDETLFNLALDKSRDDLDILASLVGKSTERCSQGSNSTEENLALHSHLETSKGSSVSMKRKASNSIDFDQNDVSLSKKQCCDELSSNISPKSVYNDDICDLTQSRNSNEQLVENNCQMDKENILMITKSNTTLSEIEENMCDLTQNSNLNEQLIKSNFQMDRNNISRITKSYENLSKIEENMSGLAQRCSPDSNLEKVTSCYSNRSETDSLNCDRSEDYIPPVWDGFNDDFHYDYAFNATINTPNKLLESASKTSFSTKLSENNTSPAFSNQSLLSRPSTKSVTNISSTPMSSSPGEINCISSDSKSPKRLSQKTLHDYSPKSNCNFQHCSDIEIIEHLSSPEITPLNSLRAKKNLSAQFDISKQSDESHSTTSPITSQRSVYRLNKSPTPSNSELPNQYMKRDSLAAIQRLLDDSLNINESFLTAADALLETKVSTFSKIKVPELNIPSTSVQSDDKSIDSDNRKNLLTTPSPKIIASDDVTPLPNYSAMKTPLLKKELSRYGLKPSLGRRKGKLLLRYIYEQTHPLVPDRQDGEFKEPIGQPPRSPVKSPRKIEAEVNLVDSDSESDETCSQRSTGSSVYSSVTLPEESFCESEDILTQELSSSGDIKSSIKKLILCDPELHRKVLLYEPIYLEELMATLKSNGIKSKVNDVMDFLDEQCITFRTTSWKATNEKRKKKLKSPKKRSKDICNSDVSKTTKTSTGSKATTPSKSQVTKKRGRPKKTVVHDNDP